MGGAGCAIVEQGIGRSGLNRRFDQTGRDFQGTGRDQELEKARDGVLAIMPLSEFEELVKKTRGVHAKPSEEGARFRHANYSATLVGDTFRDGRGQWQLHGGKGPTILPLGSPNLALANVKWEQGGDAVLGEFDGKTFGLLVGEGRPTSSSIGPLRESKKGKKSLSNLSSLTSRVRLWTSKSRREWPRY